jgi:DNA-binding transcriptional regulator YdaS (Cro superfamily)
VPHPFEVAPAFLEDHLDEMVDATMSDMVSEFLVMPKGEGFVEYPAFREAYEVLKRETTAFADFNEKSVFEALRQNSRVFGVLRAILGLSPPEWAELARSEGYSDVSQTAARTIDRHCRQNPGFVKQLEHRVNQISARHHPSPSRVIPGQTSLARLRAMASVAVAHLNRGAPVTDADVVHRLDKFDTREGIVSIRHAAQQDVPYAVVLYERFLGRPFATHRDAVSELVGEVMENAIEGRLRAQGITFRKTKRAERIPGFDQAPDFCVPDEVAPSVVIEAKITSDDGTARDEVARILRLATQRDNHVAAGYQPYEVVACIDGRGFRVRREDMRQMLVALQGKVFTTATLDQLVSHTRLRDFVTTRGADS